MAKMYCLHLSCSVGIFAPGYSCVYGEYDTRENAVQALNNLDRIFGGSRIPERDASVYRDRTKLTVECAVDYGVTALEIDTFEWYVVEQGNGESVLGLKKLASTPEQKKEKT